jgi:hypothetical protein
MYESSFVTQFVWSYAYTFGVLAAGYLIGYSCCFFVKQIDTWLWKLSDRKNTESYSEFHKRVVLPTRTQSAPDAPNSSKSVSPEVWLSSENLLHSSPPSPSLSSRIEEALWNISPASPLRNGITDRPNTVRRERVTVSIADETLVDHAVHRSLRQRGRDIAAGVWPVSDEALTIRALSWSSLVTPTKAAELEIPPEMISKAYIAVFKRKYLEQ